jgi:ribosomal-protein-alanine N-acetyltransferase
MTKEIEMKNFETKRLILRKITELDIPSYQKNIADYEVIRFLSSKVPWPYPADGAEVFLNSFVFPRLGIDRWFWGIFLKEDPSEVIGAVDLWREPCPENRGFWLAKKHWGKGIMSEAVRPITEYAFTHLGFEKLILSNAVGNHASSRIKEKFGAKLLGTRKAEFATGEFHEAQTWELTRDDWFKHNGESKKG